MTPCSFKRDPDSTARLVSRPNGYEPRYRKKKNLEGGRPAEPPLALKGDRTGGSLTSTTLPEGGGERGGMSSGMRRCHQYPSCNELVGQKAYRHDTSQFSMPVYEWPLSKSGEVTEGRKKKTSSKSGNRLGGAIRCQNAGGGFVPVICSGNPEKKGRSLKKAPRGETIFLLNVP